MAFVSYPSIDPSGLGVSQNHVRQAIHLDQLKVLRMIAPVPLRVAMRAASSLGAPYGYCINRETCLVRSRNCSYSRDPNVSRPDGGMAQTSRVITTSLAIAMAVASGSIASVWRPMRGTGMGCLTEFVCGRI